VLIDASTILFYFLAHTAARKRWFILLQFAAQGEEVIIVERGRNQHFKLVLVGKVQKGENL
jgi:hypothetical protein